jgi:hypothetical protein
MAGTLARDNPNGNSMIEYSTDGCRDFCGLAFRSAAAPIRTGIGRRANQLPKPASWHDSVLSQLQSTTIKLNPGGQDPDRWQQTRAASAEAHLHKLQRKTNSCC